ncbi:MAG TPA: non-homologous end-joining DNA ligase [Chryseosolibacter sp.]
MRSVRSKGKEKLTSFHKPMLATLGDQPFNDPEWIFEIKWDGYRAIAQVGSSEVQLYSRNGLSFKPLYPSLAEALTKLKIDAVLDGEIVVFNEDNKPDFQQLQQFGDVQKGKLMYYVFDCLYVKGKSIMDKPLLERKEILKRLLPENEMIRYADHVEENGLDVFQRVKGMDLEGMIAKRSSSKYKIGTRTSDWLKIKNHNTQEAIIAGYTEPRGSRKFFGALVLAIQQGSELVYIGHTGTGFSDQTLREVFEKLQPLVRKKSPFSKKVPVKANVTWVAPKLVCNIKYSEITQGGILRHPVFLGLRIDKNARETNQLDQPISTKRVIEKSHRKPVKKTSLKPKTTLKTES